MKTTLRKIGNSRGVLIPAALLATCNIQDEVELRVDGGRIVIEPMHAPRSGWFDGYNPKQDEDVWKGLKGTPSESEDWVW